MEDCYSQQEFQRHDLHKVNYYFILDDYTESIFLLYYLTPFDTFIDIGSNHGHYTLLSSGIVGNSTISIEPVRETFNRLKSNIEINQLDNIKLMNLGVSNKIGKLRISNNKGSINKILKDQVEEYLLFFSKKS